MTETVIDGGAPAPDANASQPSPDAQQLSAPDKRPSDADPSSAAHETGVSEQQPKAKGVQRRLDELTRNWREAQRQNERLLAMLEQRNQAPPTQAEPEAKRSLKDFNYDENAYRDHLYQEARKHAEDAAKQAGIKWKAEQDAIGRRAKFDERVTQFAATVEDYHDVVTPSTPVSEGMADAIMDSEEAGALMYYFGQHPDIALKLYHLSAAKAGREIQKIEDRLVAERKKAAEKPVSKAPEPPPKVEGGDPGSVEKDPSQMSDAEFSKWFRKQRKR